MHFNLSTIILVLALLFWLLALIPATANAYMMPLSIFMIIVYLIVGAVGKT